MPRTKGGAYKKYKAKYIECRFDLKLLPIKMNLPMVCAPMPWRIVGKLGNYIKSGGKVPQMSDLTGAYYTHKKASMIVNRYRMLTSREYEHFYICFNSLQSCQAMCNIIKGLQMEPFIVNSKLLDFIKSNQDFLVEKELLMPPMLANISPHTVYNIMRTEFSTGENKEKSKFSTNVDILDKRIQRARYEQFLIQLATAYEGRVHFLSSSLP